MDEPRDFAKPVFRPMGPPFSEGPVVVVRELGLGVDGNLELVDWCNPGTRVPVFLVVHEGGPNNVSFRMVHRAALVGEGVWCPVGEFCYDALCDLQGQGVNASLELLLVALLDYGRGRGGRPILCPNPGELAKAIRTWVERPRC